MNIYSYESVDSGVFEVKFIMFFIVTPEKDVHKQILRRLG